MATEPPDPERPSSPPKKTGESGRFRWRRILSPLLIVLASIILFVSVLAIWIDFSMLDTDEFTETSSEILADEEVQAVLAPYLVNQIFSSAELSSTLAQALPGPLSALAGPAAAGLEEVATRTAARLLASQRFQTLWAAANREAHQQFITIVEGDARAIATINGQVVLNLRPMTEQLFERLGLPTQVLATLPAGRGEIVIMQESQLTSLQKLVDVLQKIAKWFWVFALLLYAAAVWIARGRRREAIRGVGLSFLLVGLGLAVLVRLGGPRVVESLVAVPANEPAALSVWQILTANLRDSARALLLVGAIILVGAWLVGPGRWATGARRWLAPYMRRPVLVYGAVALVVLLILLFVPLRENRSFLSTLVFLGALVLGVETVRRMSIREFPEEGAVPTEDKTVG
jgi:hypothetical protein